MKKENVRRIYLGHLDPFLKYLVLPGIALPKHVEVGGTLFRCFLPYRGAAGMGPPIQRALRMGKDLLVSRAVANGGVHLVTTFDPAVASTLRDRSQGPTQIRCLAEPVEFEVDPGQPQPQDDHLEALIVGAIQPRKGVLEAIAGLREYTAETQQPVRLRILGAVVPDFGKEIRSALARAATLPTFACDLQDRWLTDEEIHTAIRSADCVLAVYPRFMQSSGIVALASHLNRPTVAGNWGWMGRVVRDNELGVVVEGTSPPHFVEALRLLNSKEWSGIDQRWKEFRDSNFEGEFGVGIAEWLASNLCRA